MKAKPMQVSAKMILDNGVEHAVRYDVDGEDGLQKSFPLVGPLLLDWLEEYNKANGNT